jgi:cytochrome P450
MRATASKRHHSMLSSPHFCLDANLARMEGAIAIASILERLRNLRLANPDAPPQYRGSYLLRGVDR